MGRLLHAKAVGVVRRCWWLSTATAAYLFASYHEAACGQVLASGGSLGHLQGRKSAGGSCTGSHTGWVQCRCVCVRISVYTCVCCLQLPSHLTVVQTLDRPQPLSPHCPPPPSLPSLSLSPPHLMVCHPPCAGDQLCVPGLAAAHTRTARLLQGQGGHGLAGVVVADDGAAGTVKLSVNIHILCRVGTGTRHTAHTTHTTTWDREIQTDRHFHIDMCSVRDRCNRGRCQSRTVPHACAPRDCLRAAPADRQAAGVVELGLLPDTHAVGRAKESCSCRQ